MGIFSKYGLKIKLLFKFVFLFLYFVYFGYVMYYRFGDEGFICLLVCIILGVLIFLFYIFNWLFGFKFKFSLEERLLFKEKKIKKIKWYMGRFVNFLNLICIFNNVSKYML